METSLSKGGSSNLVGLELLLPHTSFSCSHKPVVPAACTSNQLALMFRAVEVYSSTYYLYHWFRYYLYHWFRSKLFASINPSKTFHCTTTNLHMTSNHKTHSFYLNPSSNGNSVKYALQSHGLTDPSPPEHFSTWFKFQRAPTTF